MKEFSINLSPGSGVHLYEQIYCYIRDEIRAGRLTKGEKLPSTRSLAEFLQISRSTAETAYEQLLSEGYIESRPSSGFYVADIEGLYDFSGSSVLRKASEENDIRVGRMRENLPGAESAVRRENFFPGRESADSRGQFSAESAHADSAHAGSAAGENIIDFSPRRIDMSQFPYSTWKRITRNVLTAGGEELFALGDPCGELTLRETIARYLYTSRGVLCDPGDLIIGAGNDFLLMLLCRLLKMPGETLPAVGMEYVTYLRACHLFRTFGWRVAPVSMDRNGMSVDSLRRSGARLAYVMPAHQYPAGITMPIARRLELLAWAGEDRERYILEDDYDSEFRYRGKPIPSLRASDREGRVIYLGTFSKSIAPAIRMSYMLLPHPLMERFRSSLFFLSSTVSRLDQRILEQFIRDGYFERYLNKMRNGYRGKRDLLLEALEPLKERFTVSGEGAGLHLLLTERTSGNKPEETAAERERKLAVLAGRQGVLVHPMSDNQIPGAPEELPLPGILDGPTLLLGYAALTPEDIREGVDRLLRSWKQDRRKTL